MNRLLCLCFTISGAAALALEVLWMRSAGLVLGSTAHTTAAVLACYFAGIGFGAAYGQRIQRRPVRVYGLLELGAGIGALGKLVPEVILAAESQGSGADLTEAHQALVGLRAQQECVHQRLEEMEQRLREMRDSVEGLR